LCCPAASAGLRWNDRETYREKAPHKAPPSTGAPVVPTVSIIVLVFAIMATGCGGRSVLSSLEGLALQQPPVDGDETGGDHCHADKVLQGKLFSQDQRAEDDGTDRNEKGNERKVCRAS